MSQKVGLIKRLFHHALLFFNLVAILWLLACKWVSVSDPVSTVSYMSLLTFTGIFAAFANLAFAVYWLVFTRKRWRSLFSILTLTLLWGFVSPMYGIHFFSDNNLDPGQGDLKIMTWNVHLFDLGAWTQDETARGKIIDLINDEAPDVVCLEEFYRDLDHPEAPYTDIIQGLGYPYMAFARETLLSKRKMTINAGKKDVIEIGNVIFSKFPLKDVEEYDLGNSHKKFLTAKVEIENGEDIGLAVVHLTSVGFKEAEMDYLDSLKKRGIEAQQNTKSKTLAYKLASSFSTRAVLANKIDSLKRFIDLPMVIVGDFNDIPGSYVYNKIKGEMTDPFVEKGIGLGRTYRYISPTLRIDHIFVDQNHFKVLGYQRRKEDLSDHFPVIANLSFQ